MEDIVKDKYIGSKLRQLSRSEDWQVFMSVVETEEDKAIEQMIKSKTENSFRYQQGLVNGIRNIKGIIKNYIQEV